jgi:hypothetical protein
MHRFIYNASAFAIGGRITRPIDHVIESVASTDLPSVGGRANARSGPFSLTAPDGEFLLSWESGETSITGGEETASYVTEINSSLRGLKVGRDLQIDEIVLHMLVRYEKNGRKSTFDPSGSAYRGVNLGGKSFDVTIDCDMGKAGSDFDKFHHDHPHYPFCAGKVCYSLGRNQDLIFENDDNGMYVQPDFGRIYFAEWSCGPGVQNLTMLRLNLGSPQGGELESGGGGVNGTTFP